MYSARTSSILACMVLTGVGRSIGVKLFYQLGYTNPLFVSVLYLLGQSLSIVVYLVSKLLNKNNLQHEKGDLHSPSEFSLVGSEDDDDDESSMVQMDVIRRSNPTVTATMVNGDDMKEQPQESDYDDDTSETSMDTSNQTLDHPGPMIRRGSSHGLTA
eukprot:CAMPEP_0194437608 /NCGR_PEP_ID=MMETSP0176-20130528/100853_1 /TAXON_ID=216777 /ORGANISM="Proboscia alata, Strain PI-D3" /LENGTH=157 /DNA_ID=CAMNT_0039259019 /DNA_START=201 /DNA_END=670 /DNA_ORIENTATION=+